MEDVFLLRVWTGGAGKLRARCPRTMELLKKIPVAEHSRTVLRVRLLLVPSLGNVAQGKTAGLDAQPGGIALGGLAVASGERFHPAQKNARSFSDSRYYGTR